MRLLLTWCLALLLSVATVGAQDSGLPPSINIGTTNISGTITTGGTYQLLLAGVTPTFANPLQRRTFTFQNNNATNTSDNCYLIFGTNITSQIVAGTTTLSSTLTINGHSLTYQQASVRLTNSGSDGRYTTYIPQDNIYGTCDSTGDSIYGDWN